MKNNVYTVSLLACEETNTINEAFLCSKVTSEKPQSWKKISAISQASRNPDKMSVTMVRSHHQQDEDETEVEADSITKGKNIPPIKTV